MFFLDFRINGKDDDLKLNLIYILRLFHENGNLFLFDGILFNQLIYFFSFNFCKLFKF